MRKRVSEILNRGSLSSANENQGSRHGLGRVRSVEVLGSFHGKKIREGHQHNKERVGSSWGNNVILKTEKKRRRVYMTCLTGG